MSAAQSSRRIDLVMDASDRGVGRKVDLPYQITLDFDCISPAELAHATSGAERYEIPLQPGDTLMPVKTGSVLEWWVFDRHGSVVDVYYPKQLLAPQKKRGWAGELVWMLVMFITLCAIGILLGK